MHDRKQEIIKTLEACKAVLWDGEGNFFLQNKHKFICDCVDDCAPSLDICITIVNNILTIIKNHSTVSSYILHSNVREDIDVPFQVYRLNLINNLIKMYSKGINPYQVNSMQMLINPHYLD